MASRDEEYVLNLARLTFYKHYFGKILTALIIALGINLVLIAGFIIVKTQKVEREYFAYDHQTGRMTPLVPMNTPYLSQGALLTWVVDCVTSTNTYDFVNYQKQFQQNSQCFTKKGWDDFAAAVERAGTLENVKAQRLVASAVATGAPIVTREGIKNGAYAWQIELPIIVTFQGGQAGRSVATQKLLVNLLVTRLPTYESKTGVGIEQYVGQER